METVKSQIGPALFFCVDGNLLFHGCSLEDGEPYGKFINYPHSHFDIWNDNYEQKYGVEFDYYPRGRVVYRSSDDTFLIYYDKCMEPHLESVTSMYAGRSIITDYDEHYQCHMCNEDYII